MLIGINPLLGPDLLYILGAMGHGDEIVIADANFPGSSAGPECLRLDGISASAALEAILSVFPLDTFTDHPAQTMQVVGEPDTIPPAVQKFQAIIDRIVDRPQPITSLERFKFYERASAAFAIVQTGEKRPYGNIILTKGIII